MSAVFLEGQDKRTLHQESQDDIPSSMQFIVRLRVGHDFGFHCGSGSHWVFSSDTDTVKELGEGVTDDPSIEGCTP
jgi:hypothetical protein